MLQGLLKVHHVLETSGLFLTPLQNLELASVRIPCGTGLARRCRRKQKQNKTKQNKMDNP